MVKRLFIRACNGVFAGALLKLFGECSTVDSTRPKSDPSPCRDVAGGIRGREPKPRLPGESGSVRKRTAHVCPTGKMIQKIRRQRRRRGNDVRTKGNDRDRMLEREERKVRPGDFIPAREERIELRAFLLFLGESLPREQLEL